MSSIYVICISLKTHGVHTEMIEFDDRGTVTLSLLKAKCSYSSVHSSKTLFEISSLIVTTVLSSYVVFLTDISESYFLSFIHASHETYMDPRNHACAHPLQQCRETPVGTILSPPRTSHPDNRNLATPFQFSRDGERGPDRHYAGSHHPPRCRLRPG